MIVKKGGEIKMYTKEERCTIYKQALELIKSGTEFCICYAIDSVTGKYPSHKIMEEEFPELFKYKPKGVYFWWFEFSPNGTKKRIRILINCINKTDEKSFSSKFANFMNRK